MCYSKGEAENRGCDMSMYYMVTSRQTFSEGDVIRAPLGKYLPFIELKDARRYIRPVSRTERQQYEICRVQPEGDYQEIINGVITPVFLGCPQFQLRQFACAKCVKVENKAV